MYEVCLFNTLSVTVSNIVNININTDANMISFFDSLDEGSLPVLIISADNFAYIKKID